MRILLADLMSKHGYVVKDTVVGGYGSRMSPFSKTTRLYCHFKRNFHQVPSVQMATIAGIIGRSGSRSCRHVRQAGRGRYGHCLVVSGGLQTRN